TPDLQRILAIALTISNQLSISIVYKYFVYDGVLILNRKYQYNILQSKKLKQMQMEVEMKPLSSFCRDVKKLHAIAQLQIEAFCSHLATPNIFAAPPLLAILKIASMYFSADLKICPTFTFYL
ncbi:MAG TPA: hypothetical protein VLB04_01225, partial [Methanotrichaceae archaeon]|nr:hypothetical protein [Methanotrichaceae archaeon]